MSPYIVDVDERGATVQRTHGVNGKIVGLTMVIGDLVGRHNQRT